VDIAAFRKRFPALVDSDSPAYLDNACMTLRPDSVIASINQYYSLNPSCGGRSVHRWGLSVSQTVARTRKKMASHIGAENPSEIIFTPNATHSINQVAHGINWREGDVVITSDREHNSNLVPWLKLAELGVELRTVKSHDDNTFDIENFENICAEVGNKLRMVSLVHVGNLDGVEIPVKTASKIAHDHGAIVHIDGAQSVPHLPVDITDIGCDLLSFSIHKMLGPTGMGVLWGKEHILSELEPICAGGGTVTDADKSGYSLKEIPSRLEGGLGHYAGISGTEAALDFLSNYDMQKFAEQEIRINNIISEGIKNLPNVEIIGPESARERGGICSILLDGIDVQNTGILLDEMDSVFVRSGLHCVNQWFNDKGIEQGSLRASAYAYNNDEDAKRFVDSFSEIIETLSR